jgi:prolipoprotein diacylglyceryltransferase
MIYLKVSIEGFLDVFDPNASGIPSGIFSGRLGPFSSYYGAQSD